MYFIKFVLLSATVAVVSSNIDKTKLGLRLSWTMNFANWNVEMTNLPVRQPLYVYQFFNCLVCLRPMVNSKILERTDGALLI